MNSYGSNTPQNADNFLLDEDSNDELGDSGLDNLNQIYLNIYRNYKHSYRDFETIDWFKDFTIPKQTFPKKSKVSSLFDAGSGWIAVTLIGLATGLVTFIFMVSINVLLDYRDGHCQNNILYDNLQCSWTIKAQNCANMSQSPWLSHEAYFINKGYTDQSAYVFSYFIYVVLSVMFGGLAAWITYLIAPYAIGSSIAEVETILNGFVLHDYLGLSTAIVKCVTCVLAVASGLNIGFECTLVYIGTAFGNLVSRLFSKYNQNEAKKRELLTSGASAGLSCPLNAPIGGLLFCFEEACQYFSFKTLWRTFWCTMISTLVCYYLVSTLQNSVIFRSKLIDGFQIFEIIPFTIIGVFGGIFGFLIIKVFYYMCWVHKNTIVGRYPIHEVLITTFIISLISYKFPLLKTTNYRLLYDMFGECSNQYSIDSSICKYSINGSLINNAKHVTSTFDTLHELKVLAPIFCLKLLFLFASFALKVPNGFFFPIMTIGALFGRLVGNLMKLIWLNFPSWYVFQKHCLSHEENEPCIDISSYAMIGACAFFAGSTHLTVTLVVIIIELTNGSAYTVPLMISAFVAKSISKILTKHNIFQVSFTINDYPFIDKSIIKKSDLGSADEIISNKKIRTNNRHILYLTLQPVKVIELFELLRHPYYSFPLIESSNSPRFIGSIVSHVLFKKLNDLVEHNYDIASSTEITFDQSDSDEINKTEFSQIVDYNYITVSPTTSVYQLIQIFDLLGVHCVHVIRNGNYVDIITKKDLIKYIQTII